MGYFKFDKLDKIVIAFTFIVVTMFSIFNCFCFAATPVELIPVDGIGTNVNDISAGFVYRSDLNGGYFQMLRGHDYILKNMSSNEFVYYVYSENVPELGGAYKSARVAVSPGESASFTADDDMFLYFYAYGFPDDILSYINIVDITPGFSGVIGKLFTYVGISQLWSVFDVSLPFILILVVVAFGIYLITRMIKGSSKGKGRL